jgi:dihydroneopterin aldolase/2-amino-4-hydroxy-6-hydroxymethyldihydropteridine diphosphokinase/dihydropteroate synthase
LNAVLKVGTCLSPESLLVRLKEIEEHSGRNFKEIRNGPRTVDLDILYFDTLEYKSSTLTIPHPRIQEREFVLRPLCDIAPSMSHPTLYRSNENLLGLLKHAEKSSDYPCYRVFPLRSKLHKIDHDGTILMGILNVTPDSFSDGGQYNSVQVAIEKVNQMIQDGAIIIDVGGQSTRPGAEEISEEEEINRVIPVIKSIREAYPEICLSVDTYRASVAKQALLAGADMINDVTGGNRDGDAMRKVWKEFACSVCLMHMRGTPKTMSQLTEYKDVVQDVREALEDLVNITIQQGTYRWNLMIDPGIGFAKTTEQNYELLRKLSDIAKGSCDRLPLLVGVSRKGFIGISTGSKDPKDPKRVWGTSAACTVAVMGGCHVLRVHDVAEIQSVVAVANVCRP